MNEIYTILASLFAGGLGSLLAMWRSAGIQESKVKGLVATAENLVKACNQIPLLVQTIESIDQRVLKLENHRENDGKEISNILSEMKQWITRLETTVDFMEKGIHKKSQ